MHRLSEKLMAVMLALTLVLAPMQGVMAGFASSSEQEVAMHQMPGMDHDMTMAGDQMAYDCDRCDDDTGCNGHACSSVHCASCVVVALLPDFSYQTHFTVERGIVLADNTLPNQPFSSLFRPPRV